MQIKPSYDDDRIVLADHVPLRSPLAMQISFTTKCNLRCNYCIQHEKMKRMHMDDHTFILLRDQLENMPRLKQITVSGWGEPLMYPRLVERLTELKLMGIADKISLVTNGILLTPRMVEQLVPVVNTFKISLQGLTDQKYQDICGKNVNIHRLVEQLDYLYSMKGSRNLFIKIADIALARGEEGRFYDTFGPIADRVYIESIRPIFSCGDGKCMSKWGELHDPIMVCPHPFYNINITPDGSIIPCCSYYDPTRFGKIYNSDIMEIWRGEQMKDFQRMLLRKERNQQMEYFACNGCKIPDVIITRGDELDDRADEIFRRGYEVT